MAWVDKRSKTSLLVDMYGSLEVFVFSEWSGAITVKHMWTHTHQHFKH